MKIYTLIFLIFFATLSTAQTHRFIYEYQFKPNSESTEYRKENMALDINPIDIKFYAYENILNDSINKKGGNNHSSSIGIPALKRDKNSSQNLNYELIAMDYFSYQTTDKMDWKLDKETKTSGQYTLQKATITFGGREWTAWFSKDINISEGPYKFRGLPGLIFELNDNKNNFIFKLIKSQKLEKTYDTSDFLENFGDKKPLAVKIKDFNKLMLQFYNDPMQDLKKQFDNVPSGTFKVGGKPITSKDQFKAMSKNIQDYIKKSYNPLDLTNAVIFPNLN